MGLFDGGMDMELLMQMLNPMGTANAAGAIPNPMEPAPFEDRFGAAQAQGVPSTDTTASNMSIQPGLGPNGAPKMPLTPNALAASPVANALAAQAPVPLPTPRPAGATYDDGQGPFRLDRGIAPALTPSGQSTEAVPPKVRIPVGAALTGEDTVPPPPGATPPGATPSGGTSGSTDISGRAKTPEEQRASLSQALKGVVAPKPPEIQKISTPNAPRPSGTIKSGELQALLMAFNSGAGNMTRQLPVTLGRG